jgi:hypothetical protein
VEKTIQKLEDRNNAKRGSACKMTSGKIEDLQHVIRGLYQNPRSAELSAVCMMHADNLINQRVTTSPTAVPARPSGNGSSKRKAAAEDDDDYDDDVSADEDEENVIVDAAVPPMHLDVALTANVHDLDVYSSYHNEGKELSQIFTRADVVDQLHEPYPSSVKNGFTDILSSSYTSVSNCLMISAIEEAAKVAEVPTMDADVRTEGFSDSSSPTWGQPDESAISSSDADEEDVFDLEVCSSISSPIAFDRPRPLQSVGWERSDLDDWLALC